MVYQAIKEMKEKNLFIKIPLIVLLLLCLFRMPYSFYEISRFIGMIGFAIIGYEAFKKQNTLFIIIWFSSALLINPFFKLALGRTLWNIIDFIWIILLLISLKQRN